MMPRNTWFCRLDAIIEVAMRGAGESRHAVAALISTAGFLNFLAPSEVRAQPVVVEMAYTGEVWANTTGGLKTGSTYLDNFDASVTIDADRAIGWSYTEVHVSVLYNNSGRLSETLVGDIQTVSNIETDGAFRLYEAWIATKIGTVEVKLGAIDLNSEFDVIETAGLFIGSSHGIGPDFSQVGENGPSIFPVIGLGARATAKLTDRLSLKIGLFEGTPGDPNQLTRTRFGFDDGEGVLGVVETAYRVGDSGRLALGVRQHSGRFDTINADGPPKRERLGAYAMVDGPIARLDERRSLSAFLRVGIADPRVHRVEQYLGGGIVLQGLRSDDDQLGVSVAIASNGPQFIRTKPNFNKRETAIELTYRTVLNDYLTIQPNVQSVINPGAEPNLANALVVGLRAVIGWSSARSDPR